MTKARAGARTVAAGTTLARPRTPGEQDVHVRCGGIYVRKLRGPGRVCGWCGEREPEREVRVRLPDGTEGWQRRAVFLRGRPR